MRISDWSSDVCSSDLPLQRDAVTQLGLGILVADRPAIGGPDQIEAAALVGFVALACFELILDIRIAAVADQRDGRIAVAAVADDQWLEAAQPLGDAEHIAILEAAALRILAVDRDLDFGGGAQIGEEWCGG